MNDDAIMKNPKSQLLADRNMDGAALREAVVHNRVETVRTIVGTGSDIKDHYGTALRWAAARGHADIARILLDAGVARNDHAYALIGAADNGHVAVVRMLLTTGANVHASYETALFCAAIKGHTDVVRILVSAGTDPMALWPKISQSARNRLMATLDASADMMNPAQRDSLAKLSMRFSGLHAQQRAMPHRRRLQR